MNGMHSRIDESETQCQKLYAQVRLLSSKVETLEEALENEQRARVRVSYFI